jgi:hypothetical protein
MSGVMFEFLTKRVVPVMLAIGACSAFAQSSEDRAVGPFSRLSVQNGIDVYLSQADQEHLRVEVEGYELDDVVSEVEGDELRLYRKGPRRSGFLADNRIAVYLDFVQLSSIEASGGSDIHGRNDMQLEALAVRASGGSDVDLDLEATRLELVLAGGSDVRARGSAQSLSIEASGGSDVSAGSLEAERVRLALAGGCDASVRASAAIEIDASGGSDVAVYGNPAERQVRNDRSSDVVWR